MAYLAWAVQKNELLKAYFGEDYDQANLLKDYSPVQNAHSQYPPTLLVHGKSDNLTPIIHSQNMYEALKNENAKVEIWSPEG
jgi:dipeptidyl aminopeptidase/acylaminoacyl peptidase